VKNKQGDKWDLCASNATDQQAWVCAISQVMGRPCSNGSAQAGPLIINEKQTIKEPMILIPLPSPACNEDWTYASHGSDWNCKCSEGFEQSPINVERRCVSNINETASFQWSKVNVAKLATYYEDNMMKIRCKNTDPKDCVDTVFARIIDSDFAEYECKEIRFHTPAEHTIEGRKFDMEIQLIYHPTSEGDYKKKAGMAFLALQGPGKNNKFLDALDFMSLPNVYQQKIDMQNGTNGESELDVEELFKDVDDVYEYNGFFNYWRYVGSITAPPCDEHTRWFIIEKPVHVGYAALSMIKDVLQIPTLGASQSDGSVKYVADLNTPKNPDGNNRDAMPIRDRGILYYDTKASNCAPQPVRRPTHGAGHYEKVPRKTETFIWVNGLKPSAIEGSFVVPEWEAKGLDSPEEQRDKDINNIASNNE
jgi:carbonic anhydrase